MKLAIAIFTIGFAGYLFARFGKPDADANHNGSRRRPETDFTHEGSE